jgi:hypothetical protein
MIRYKQATAKSDHTIFDYRVTLKKLLFHFPDDPPIASVPRAPRVEFSCLAVAGVCGGPGWSRSARSSTRASQIGEQYPH